MLIVNNLFVMKMVREVDDSSANCCGHGWRATVERIHDYQVS